MIDLAAVPLSPMQRAIFDLMLASAGEAIPLDDILSAAGITPDEADPTHGRRLAANHVFRIRSRLKDAGITSVSIETSGASAYRLLIDPRPGEHDRIPCPHCSARLKSSVGLHRHLMAFHPEPGSSVCACPVCGDEFPVMQRMRTHLWGAHGLKAQDVARGLLAAANSPRAKVSQAEFFSKHGEYEDDPRAVDYCLRNEGVRWRGCAEDRMSAPSPLVRACG